MSVGHVQIVSVSSDCAIVRFAFAAYSRISYELRSEDTEQTGRTEEPNATGRIELAELMPNTHYDLKVMWDRNEAYLHFRTLRKPAGDPLCRYAVIGDPHLASKPENRKGRLHVESALILRGVVASINSETPDFVLGVGDILDLGTADEYRWAEDIFASLKSPFYTVVGNHDLSQGEGSRAAWQQLFGEYAFHRRHNHIEIVGLDTSDRQVRKPTNERQVEACAPDRLVVAVSHYQLIPDEYILAGDKAVLDAYAPSEAHLFGDRQGIIYVGHKNVPARVALGNMLQINLPQLTHYPCGYLSVALHSNGIFHKFVPIESDVLNEYSRQGCVACATPECAPMYRDRHLLDSGSFVYEYHAAIA